MVNATTPSAGASVKNAATVPVEPGAGCVGWLVTPVQPLIPRMITSASEQTAKRYFVSITAGLTFTTRLGYELVSDNSAGRGARTWPVPQGKGDLCQRTVVISLRN